MLLFNKFWLYFILIIIFAEKMNNVYFYIINNK
jgi:hypothetical protein